MLTLKTRKAKENKSSQKEEDNQTSKPMIKSQPKMKQETETVTTTKQEQDEFHPRLSPNQKAPPLTDVRTTPTTEKENNKLSIFKENETVSPINESSIDTSNLYQRMTKIENYLVQSNKSMEIQHQKLHDLSIRSNKYNLKDDTTFDEAVELQKNKTIITDQMDEIMNEIKKLDNSIKESKQERDTIKQQLTNIKIDLQQTTKDVTENTFHLRTQKEKLANLQAKTQEQQQEINQLKKMTDTHAIKLRPSSYTPSSPWQLHSDNETYPILNSTDSKYNHFAKFRSYLEDLELQGDNLKDIKKWWNSINSKLMTTLGTNKALPQYKDLTPNYNPRETLIPPPEHPQHDEATQAYENFSQQILDYIIDNDSIKEKNAPIMYQYAVEEQMAEDGFELLTRLVIKASPQLGGDARNPANIVSNLTVNNGEQLATFYIRTLRLYHEIHLQEDPTGQRNRLVEKFVHLLFYIPAYTECLREVFAALNDFFRDPLNHQKLFPITITEIYKRHLINKGAPLVINKIKKTSIQKPKLNTITTPTEKELQLEIEPQQNDKDHDNYYEQYYDQVQIPEPKVCAGTFNMNQSREENKSHRINNNNTDRQRRYKPNPKLDIRCECCGLTTREWHQQLNDLHDPTDPNSCLFRGPKFNKNKQTKERLNQYNIKHANDKGIEKLSEEETLRQQKQLPHPPTLQHISVQQQKTEELTEDDEWNNDDESETKPTTPTINNITPSPPVIKEVQPPPQLGAVITGSSMKEKENTNNNDNEEYDYDLRYLEAFQDIIA